MKKFFINTGLLIQKRILLFFLCALVTIILFVRLIGVYSRDTNTTEFVVNHTYEIIKHVENIKSSVAESESACKSYLLTRDDRWLQQMKAAQLTAVKSLSEAMVLIQDTVQKTKLKNLEKAVHQKIIFQQALTSEAPAISLAVEKTGYESEGSKISNSIQFLLDEFASRQNLLLKEHSDASAQAKSKALTTAILGMGLFFIFIAATLVKLNEDVGRRKKAEHGIRESERKYRRLVEDAGVTMFTCNLEGLFTYVSGRCETLTEYKSTELTGKSFAILISPDWINKVAKNYSDQISTLQKETLIEFQIITKQDQIKWVEQYGVLIYNEHNHPIAFQCIVKDITERKKATLQLKKSEELIEVLLENTREGFVMVSRDFEILFLNKQAREGIFTLTGKQIEAGMGFFEMVLPQDKEQAIKNLDRVFAGEKMDFEGAYQTPGGMQCMLISHSPVMNDQGLIIGAAIVSHDITEKKQQEEKLRDSDQKMRAMLESTREGFFMIGKDYNIIMMNEVGRQNIRLLMGKECAIGDNILDYIVPDRKSIFKATFKKVIHGGVHESEAGIPSSEGQRWFHNSYFPVFNDKNEIIGICASTKDITEKKLVDIALSKIRAEREEYQFRLQSILDNTPLIIFIKDLQGRYLVVNKSFRELIKLSDEQIIGKTDFEIEPFELAQRYQKVDTEVIQTLRSIELEETIENESGRQNLLLIKFPLFDKKNSIYGVGGIATDFTDKVLYRQKLIEAKKVAESAEQLQEQFLANMSHEIRTPMNGIIGMTNVLKGTVLTEEQQDFVNIIRISSDNLLFLINDILDLSKIKSGKLSIEKIPFSLQELLEALIAPFRIKANEKDVTLEVIKDPALPIHVEGDPHRLTQIINNLLSNALKFTDEGCITLAVKANHLAEDQVAINFSVTDTGLGIPADKLESIFNSFEQANTSTARKFGGTGLGLAISRQLIEMQGGQITVSSTPGQGTQFSFTINYRISKKVETDSKKTDAIKNAKGDLTGKKILVAEDNEINQKVVHHILKSQGILPVIVNNGREAVNLLENGNVFDLIILDLQMPEMNGFQTATYIRKKLNLNTPIIAMTASALGNEKMKCFQLGMNEYITKPFSPSDLFKHLRRFLLEASPGSEVKKNISSDNNEFYNLSTLHGFDDNQYFCEILQLFLDTTPAMMKEMKEAALYENWQLVQSKAHKLKSSLGILQMHHMLELVTSIEQQAKEDKETGRVPLELRRLEELFALIYPMIETELNSAKMVTV